jgi:hypothetical protein
VSLTGFGVSGLFSVPVRGAIGRWGGGGGGGEGGLAGVCAFALLPARLFARGQGHRAPEGRGRPLSRVSGFRSRLCCPCAVSSSCRGSVGFAGLLPLLRHAVRRVELPQHQGHPHGQRGLPGQHPGPRRWCVA